MVEGDKKDSIPSPDVISKLYTNEQKVYTEDIHGVEFKYREITGSRYMDLLDQCTDGTKLLRGQYAQMLISACLIEPKSLEIGKLKPAIIGLLITSIEDKLGLSEASRKKLNMR